MQASEFPHRKNGKAAEFKSSQFMIQVEAPKASRRILPGESL